MDSQHRQIGHLSSTVKRAGQATKERSLIETLTRDVHCSFTSKFVDNLGGERSGGLTRGQTGSGLRQDLRAQLHPIREPRRDRSPSPDKNIKGAAVIGTMHLHYGSDRIFRWILAHGLQLYRKPQQPRRYTSIRERELAGCGGESTDGLAWTGQALP